MHNNSWTAAFLHMSLLLIFTLAGCGKGFKEQEDEQQEASPGRFEARLNPLNQKLARYRGWASVTISDNQFWARVKLEGPASDATHAQYIHLRGRCPHMGDDLNRDGILDFMEVYAVSGPILLPLDGNLNSQQKGLHEFPRMKRQGYYYSEACNSQRLMDDLKAPDVILRDMMTKLDDDNLDLDRRVLIIYGVSERIKLPATVRSFDGYPVHASVPVACGEIQEGSSDYFDWENY